MASGLDIAVIGMAGRFPGARSVGEFWRNLTSGIESISVFSIDEVLASGVDPALANDPLYVRAGGVLDEVELFDAAFFGYTPREAAIMDPQQRVFLECAWEAFEHAGYDTSRYRRAVGVYAGMSMNSYVLSNLIHNPAAVDAIGEAQAAISNLHDHLATRVSYKLDLRGPSFTVQTACSTSLVAVHLACQGLISGECDMALAGGVSIGLPQKAGYLYQEGGTHSPDGHCRAFDANAQGMIGGHGVASVVLKRLEDAVADGDRVWAVIKGTAINNDGASKVGYTAPSVDGQARVIRDALQVAGVSAESVSYVETHGTGTPIGDPIEFEALTRVFKTPTARTGSCGLGAVKTNVGHLDAAAGVTGLIKAVLALHHRVIPPTLHFERPNPRIDLASGPFFVVDTLRDWTSDGPRRAGVSSFGIGGTNAHVVVEEAPAARRAQIADSPQLYVLSARTATALDAAQARLAAHLEAHPDLSPADVAWTLQTGRRAWPHRLAVVGNAFDRATRVDEQIPRQTAFLFPGQGSQYPGMARALYERFGGFREPFDRCARAMRPTLGVDLLTLVNSGDAEVLARTEYAQPALFAVEYALAEWLTSLGVKPQASLGHSIGEYVAACLGGVFALEDAATLVVARGRLMSEAPRGAMVAVPLSERDAAEWLDEDVSLAAINGPAACVLAGALDAIASLETRLAARAIACAPLRTSHAFHSRLMDRVVDRFAEVVSRVTLSPPRIPFVSNVTGGWIEPADATDPRYWARHLRQPVRFADGLATIASACTRLIEAGPGTTLSGLARGALRGQDVSVVATLPRADAPVEGEPFASTGLGAGRRAVAADETFLAAIGRCWAEGVEIDWQGLHDVTQRTRVPLPAYPFERTRHWIDPLPRDPSTGLGAGPSTGLGAGPSTGLGARGREREADGSGVRFHVPSWKRRPAGLAVTGDAAPKRWLIIGDAHGLGRAIADRLRSQAGARAFPLDGARGRQASDVVIGDATAMAGFDVIVYCRAAGPAGDLESTQARAFDGLVSLAQAFGEQRVFAPVRLEVISSNLHDVVGAEPLEPLSALLTGPLRVIPQEYPNVRSRNIDVEWTPGSDLALHADRIVAELRTEPIAQTVALRGGGRWILDYDAVDLGTAAPAAPIRDGDTWVIAGGFGTIGLAAARALAAQARVRLVLLARHAREDHAAVVELQRLGADVLAIACDLEDAAAVRTALERARARFGSITGVVHAAGPSGASTVCALADMNTAHVAAQFGAKVRGLIALAGAIADMPEPPATVCLASSLAAPLGGLGFAAYAAANAVMDAVATKAARGDGLTRWLSVNWDGWRVEGSVADAITAPDGQRAFTALLQHNAGPQVLAVVGDLEPRLARWINPGARPEGVQDEARPAAHASRTQPAVAATNAVEQLVVDAWGELLGVPGIGIDDNFFDLGGHSLLATQLISRLRRAFVVDVPLRVVFDDPTPRAIAAAITALRDRGVASRPAAAIRPRPHGADAPLSSQQKRLWFLQRLDPDTSAYVIPGAVRAAGRLDTGVLQRTLDALVARHESLRTIFAESRSDEPVQRVLAPSAAAMRVVDAANEADAKRLALEETRAPFDLEQGPLFRTLVLTLGPDDSLVVLTMHHIVSDGWSIAVLVGELVAIYAADTEQRPNPLPPLALQYADFAAWQDEWRRGDDAAAQLKYWSDQLANVPRLELVTDHPRPPVMTHAGATTAAMLDATTTTAVREFCRRTGATPFIVLLAAFAALLHRDTGQTDLPIGTPAANRNRAELEGLIGFFINALVIRADVSGRPSFRALVDRVKRTCLDGWANQDVPFELLVETLQPERRANHNPLFQVMFVLQNAPEARLEIPGLAFSSVDLPTTHAKFDLSLYVVETGETLSLLLEFNRDLVDAATAARMLERYQHLVTTALREPDRAVGDLEILPAAERSRILDDWNRTTTIYPREASVQELFRQTATAHPDASAATFGGEALTYGELDRRSNQLARALRARGVVRGSIVGLAVARSLDMVVGLLGILKADAAYLPLDPSHPASRRAALLDQAGVRTTVTHQEIAASASESETPLESAAGGLDLAYVMFTSGSTGEPKGVAVPHRAIVRLVRGASYARFGAGEVVLQFAPLAFDASTFEIWGALLNGGTLAIAPPGTLSLHELGQCLVGAHVTTAWLTAGLFHQMVEQEIDGLGGLRQLIAGGDVLSPSHVRRLLAHSPSTTFINGFGPTESTTFACCHPMTNADAVGDSVSIGGPIANTRAYILDARLEPVPIGVPGELYLGGDGLARGYLNRPDLTAERFVPSPFGGEPGERLYATGDVARWRIDGTIDFICRRDAQVKIRGFRVEPGEIERVIASHPGVRDTVVVARAGSVRLSASAPTINDEATAGAVRSAKREGGQPDRDADKQLVAYVVADESAADDLRAFLRDRLPDYMVPSAIVRLDALPLTPNGKVDRARVPAPVHASAAEFVAPQTPTEMVIARVWADVLQAARVGSLDNFFELGGHSLLATRVIAHLRDELQVDIPLRALFAEPTVAAFAAEVERARALGAHTGAAIQSRPRSATRIRK